MSRKRKPELFRFVHITNCEPGHVEEPRRENISIIRLSCGGKQMIPLMITLPDVQELVVRLLEVLIFHDAEIPERMLDVIFTSKGSNHRRHHSHSRIEPSVRADTPQSKITTLEMARFFQKCGRAKNDAQLLQLIGLTTREIGEARRNYPRRKKGR